MHSPPQPPFIRQHKTRTSSEAQHKRTHYALAPGNSIPFRYYLKSTNKVQTRVVHAFKSKRFLMTEMIRFPFVISYFNSQNSIITWNSLAKENKNIRKARHRHSRSSNPNKQWDDTAQNQISIWWHHWFCWVKRQAGELIYKSKFKSVDWNKVCEHSKQQY